MIGYKGFNSSDASAARNIRIQSGLRNRISGLNLTKSRLIAINSQLNNEVSSFDQDHQSVSKLNDLVILKTLKQKYPRLYDHIKSISKNA